MVDKSAPRKCICFQDFDPQTSLVKLQKFCGEHGNPYLVMKQKFIVILESQHNREQVAGIGNQQF